MLFPMQPGLCITMEARMLLVHAYEGQTRTVGFSSPDRQAGKRARLEMLAAHGDIRKLFPELKVEELVHRGEASNVILATSMKFKALLVVVGTQGIHEDEETFIGNTTGTLIKLGNTPVLAVPRNCKFAPYANMLFAVKNPHVATRDVLGPFLALQMYFHSYVTLLYVTRDSTPDLSRFPNPYPIEPHIQRLETSDSDNIYLSIESYLTAHPAHLLVVISRLRGFFEGLFAQTTTGIETFNARLPMLILHGGQRE